MTGYTERKKLVYFELNDWFSGRDYPNEEPFISWIKDNKFCDGKWCKDNKLVVLAGFIDMSRNWCIAATESWVQQNCPQLLGDYSCTYTIITHTYDKELDKPVDIKTEYSRKMSDFLRYPDDDGDVYGRFDWRFPEYAEDNFGIIWHDDTDSD